MQTLVFLLCLAAAVYGQMTFSDGWEKRAPFLGKTSHATTPQHQCNVRLQEKMKEIQALLTAADLSYEACIESLAAPAQRRLKEKNDYSFIPHSSASQYKTAQAN
ncbi:unnamed protein product, partial [Mesorhabditis spiculigera]